MEHQGKHTFENLLICAIDSCLSAIIRALLPMITIKDIAQQLGLSPSTVGRAIADHPRISRATKERVREAAETLGYVANTPARVMRGASSRLVGLLVPDVRNSFFSMVAYVLSKCFENEGFHLALSITDDDRDTEMQQVREMVSARVAGIVIVPSAAPRRETLTLLKTVPHVQFLRRLPTLHADWFGLDEERALFDATNHLLRLGHRHIGYIGDDIFPTGKARYDGFRHAFAEAKCAIDQRLVELGPATVPFGTEATARLLQQRPTALLTASVPVTVGMVDHLETVKIEIPSELSVVGFGDGSWHKWWRSGLTTLHLPVAELATSCGLWFIHCLRTGRPTDSKEPHISINRSLLVNRSTTAPPKS
jgi:LacI family repressor for deo operon, udp, cdd, tsx, nupC, and nupG